jgi:predicted PurR-regulated permease PerM
MYNRATTIWFLGISVLCVAAVAFVITRPFLYPVAFAIILAVVFYPAHERILKWTGQKPGVASLLSTLALLFLFCVPLMVILTLAANEAVGAAQYLTRKSVAEGGFTGFLTIMADRLAIFAGRWIDVSRYDVRGMVSSRVQQAGIWALGSSASILGGFVRIAFNATITLVIVFFLFRDGTRWVKSAAGAIPLSPEHANRLMDNISDTIVANVYGVLLVGIGQGLLTGIALGVVGIPSPLLLGLIAGIASVIPVVGPSIVWLPAGVYLIFTGAVWKGTFLLVWGAVVVSAVDNVLRPWVVSGKVELHPLVLIVFILGGVSAFGFLGLFLGPVIASVLAALFDMLHQEITKGNDPVPP